MLPIQSLILSIVEGVTEFLPISSTGHMILASDLLRIAQTEFAKTFEIFIQLGAILAIVSLYWKRVLASPAVWQRVAVGFIPTGIIGLVTYKLVKHYLLGNTIVTLAALFLGGILILIAEAFYTEKSAKIESIEEMSFKTAALLGVAQSIAIIPGVSRAAATILGGMGLGMKRKAAVEFSFLLAVPTMAAAAGLDLLKSAPHFSGNEFLLLALGFVGAFATALLTVKWLVTFVQNHSFKIFGIYRVVMATAFWLLVAR